MQRFSGFFLSRGNDIAAEEREKVLTAIAQIALTRDVIKPRKEWEPKKTAKAGGEVAKAARVSTYL